MSTELNAPIDSLQKACLTQRDWIRTQVSALHEMVAGWIPAPMPEGWDDGREDEGFENDQQALDTGLLLGHLTGRGISASPN